MPRPNPIKAEIVRRGLTYAEVAEALGVSLQTLYQVAAGRSDSWPRFRRDACAYFDLPEGRLFPAPRATDPVR